MPKWIDLKDRQPKHGQLVVVMEPHDLTGTPPTVDTVTLRICEWGTSSDWRFPPEQGATHWYPLPALNKEPYPELHNGITDPQLLDTCIRLEHELIERAPMIEWVVTPYLEPDMPIFGLAWKISGSIDINGLDFHCEHRLSDAMLHGSIDYLSYVVHLIANGFAQEMLK